MPLSLRRGRVTAIVEQHEGLVRLEVDGASCIAYPQLTAKLDLATLALAKDPKSLEKRFDRGNPARSQERRQQAC